VEGGKFRVPDRPERNWKGKTLEDCFAEMTIRDHVRLIMTQDGCGEGQAWLLAWTEGPEGYEQRKAK
jgi:hypothetical protein